MKDNIRPDPHHASDRALAPSVGAQVDTVESALEDAFDFELEQEIHVLEGEVVEQEIPVEESSAGERSEPDAERSEARHEYDFVDDIEIEDWKLVTLRLAALSLVSRRTIRALADCRYRNRCRKPICPTCQGITAAKHRTKWERFLRQIPKGRKLIVLRVGLVSMTLEGGIKSLRRCLRLLRKRACFASVERAFGAIEFEPTACGAGRWNTHAHLILLLHEGQRFDEDGVRETWADLLGGFEGTIHAEPLTRRWSSRARTFLPAGVLRAEEEALHAAGSVGRGARESRPCAPRETAKVDALVWEAAVSHAA